MCYFAKIGGVGLIIYKGILDRLRDAGYNTNRLRQEKLLPESTIQAIRDNGHITTRSINTVCRLLDCKPGDILDYVKED